MASRATKQAGRWWHEAGRLARGAGRLRLRCGRLNRPAVHALGFRLKFVRQVIQVLSGRIASDRPRQPSRLDGLLAQPLGRVRLSSLSCTGKAEFIYRVRAERRSVDLGQCGRIGERRTLPFAKYREAVSRLLAPFTTPSGCQWPAKPPSW